MKHLLLSLLLVTAPAAVTAECYTAVGAQFNRYIWSWETERIEQDGGVRATVGGLCEIVEGQFWSLDAGLSAGVLMGSQMFEDGRHTLGLNVGADYDDAITISLVPHWVTGEPIEYSDSYGVALQFSTRFDNLLDGIATWFSDGFDEAYREEADD